MMTTMVTPVPITERNSKLQTSLKADGFTKANSSSFNNPSFMSLSNARGGMVGAGETGTAPLGTIRDVLNVGFRGLFDNNVVGATTNNYYNNTSNNKKALSLDQRLEKHFDRLTKTKISPVDAQRVADDPEQFTKLQEAIRKRQFMTDTFLRQAYNDLLKERVDEMAPPVRRGAIVLQSKSKAISPSTTATTIDWTENVGKPAGTDLASSAVTTPSVLSKKSSRFSPNVSTPSNDGNIAAFRGSIVARSGSDGETNSSPTSVLLVHSFDVNDQHPKTPTWCEEYNDSEDDDIQSQ